MLVSATNMKQLIDIELLEDQALQADMAMLSLWIVLMGTLVGVLGAVALPHEPVTPMWFLALGIISFLVLPIHELIHAVAFKLVSGGRAHIRFGFSSWMLYTSSVGTVLPCNRFRVVLLAPSVIITLALGLVPWQCGWPLLGWFLAVVHLAGCTGDIGYVRIIASEPTAAWVQDTERGITLFSDE